MPHPLVEQLRFTRREYQRALAGITDADASKRLLPMNSLSWTIGHLAWQEQRYWLLFAQNRLLLPEVNTQFAYGAPASTPPLASVWAAWQQITQETDPWLETLDNDQLSVLHSFPNFDIPTSFGSLMLRVIYHYWYHLGENMAIRQQLGHTDLPEFVGDIDLEAPYRPA